MSEGDGWYYWNVVQYKERESQQNHARLQRVMYLSRSLQYPCGNVYDDFLH